MESDEARGNELVAPASKNEDGFEDLCSTQSGAQGADPQTRCQLAASYVRPYLAVLG